MLGHFDDRVAEQLRHFHQRNPRLHELGGAGMPQLVDPEGSELGPSACRLEPVVHVQNALPFSSPAVVRYDVFVGPVTQTGRGNRYSFS